MLHMQTQCDVKQSTHSIKEMSGVCLIIMLHRFSTQKQTRSKSPKSVFCCSSLGCFILVKASYMCLFR